MPKHALLPSGTNAVNKNKLAEVGAADLASPLYAPPFHAPRVIQKHSL